MSLSDKKKEKEEKEPTSQCAAKSVSKQIRWFKAARRRVYRRVQELARKENGGKNYNILVKSYIGISISI